MITRGLGDAYIYSSPSCWGVYLIHFHSLVKSTSDARVYRSHLCCSRSSSRLGSCSSVGVNEFNLQVLGGVSTGYLSNILRISIYQVDRHPTGGSLWPFRWPCWKSIHGVWFLAWSFNYRWSKSASNTSHSTSNLHECLRSHLDESWSIRYRYTRYTRQVKVTAQQLHSPTDM
jgi:hypothetical protein